MPPHLRTGTRADTTRGFQRPVAFWLGTATCTAGVVLHLPMYFGARHMHYHLAGMRPDPAMILGMALIGAGLVVTLYGLLPRRGRQVQEAAAGIRVRALDDAPIRAPHVLLLIVMAVAVTIDVMKPTSLAFVASGAAEEYGLRSPTHPDGGISVAWLPLSGITGTVLGSWMWGWLGDRIGRRASILFAGMLFVTTSICGTMPSFTWNIVMCLVMGMGAGGMLPITFTLLAETIPARHRGWLMVLVGGDIAGAYVITSWLAAELTPTFGWRILWLIGLPTGLVFLALNRWIPESPRFLLARGRQKEAEAVMARYGAAVVREKKNAPRTAAASAADSPPGFRTLLRRGLVGPTLAITLLGIGAGLTTYGFQQWVPTNLEQMGFSNVNSAYVVRNAALLGLPLTVLTAWMYGKLGSRWTLIALSALTGMTLFGFVIAGDALAHRQWLLSLLLVVPLSGISSVAAAVMGYAAEVYPTVVRSRGAGLAAGMTKIGGVLILALTVAAATVPSLASTALIGAVPLLAAALALVRLAPETKHRGLEDISDTLMGERTGSSATPR
ncbi:MFS transporter [Streptomyces sp. NPDC018045]|uniref:MFS transporter n=1 Tax=Streptomyces sp. NPDC018045 TaxID=3365037 RepID=UPI00379A6D98